MPTSFCRDDWVGGLVGARCFHDARSPRRPSVETHAYMHRGSSFGMFVQGMAEAMRNHTAQQSTAQHSTAAAVLGRPFNTVIRNLPQPRHPKRVAGHLHFDYAYLLRLPPVVRRSEIAATSMSFFVGSNGVRHGILHPAQGFVGSW